jgi:hypothetical protein
MKAKRTAEKLVLRIVGFHVVPPNAFQAFHADPPMEVSTFYIRVIYLIQFMILYKIIK